MDITKTAEATVVMSNESFTGKRLYGGPGPVLIHMEIAVGREVEPHASPVDMEFYVIEGEAVFTIGGEKALVGEGCLVASPRGIDHGIRNPGPGRLRLLAVKNEA